MRNFVRHILAQFRRYRARQGGDWWQIRDQMSSDTRWVKADTRPEVDGIWQLITAEEHYGALPRR